MTVATDANAVSHSACSTDVDVTWLKKSCHGVCTIRLRVGTTSSAAPRAAGTSSTAGGRPGTTRQNGSARPSPRRSSAARPVIHGAPKPASWSTC